MVRSGNRLKLLMATVVSLLLALGILLSLNLNVFVPITVDSASTTETCQEYFERRLSEGWECISLEGYNAVLQSPDGTLRPIDLRNDVETLRPNAPGDDTDFDAVGDTVNWQMVDEAIQDGDTTYVKNPSYNQQDLYNIEDSSVGSGDINFVKLYAWLKEDYSSHWLRIGIKSGVTENWSPSSIDLTSDYVLHSRQFDTDPNTSSPWTWSAINALQVGVQVITESYRGGRCTQVYVEIDYVVSVATPTVTTQAATAIEDTTATGNGNITNTGGENCDYRGIAWDTTSRGDPGALSPAASDYANYSSEGPGSYGTGAFTRSLTSLDAGTTHYARAYAHNSGGWNWGGEVSFLTKPAAPTSVSATDGTYGDKVVVTWTKSTGATGYKVYEGVNLLDTLGDVATYDDTTAVAPTITAGTAVATDGTSTAHVALSLSGTSLNAGASRTYKVVAFNATGNSVDSATNAGYRQGTLNYQWQRSDADSDASYSNISGATSSTHNDIDAPAPTITPGNAVATNGTETAHVALSLTGTSSNDGDGRYYQCIVSAVGASNSPQTSDNNRGYRDGGALSYQWQRSAGDSDDTYSNIDGATSSTHNDTAAPAGVVTPGTATASDGTSIAHVVLSLAGESVTDGEGRYYKCVLSAPNAGGQTSASNRGYRTTGSITYQWQMSDADSDANYNTDIGTTDPYNATEAPAPTITHGTCTASDGTEIAHIILTNAGASANIGDGRYFRCVVSATGASSQNSTTERGYRSVGALTYQWYRSSADSDAGYGVIGGATYTPYNDTAAPVPTITPGSTVATDGTETAHVALSLSGTSANEGDGRYYKCYHTATGATPGYTGVNRGYRGVGALTYQWQRSVIDSDADYSNILGAESSTHNDTDAPAGTVTPGTASASDGTVEAHVVLSLAGESVADGAGRYYVCVLNATGATQQTSATNRGHRTTGTITYQWQRSAADSDASYSILTGATTDPHNDTTAPADGSGRWYYCKVSATGTTTQDSTHNRGYRLVALVVVTHPCTGFDSLWAIVNGEITAGTGLITQVGFDYGPTDAYGSSWTDTGNWSVGSEFWTKLVSLSPATLFHYRAKAYDGSWSYGNDRVFSTSGSATLYEYLNTGGDGDSTSVYSANWTAMQFTSDAVSHTVTSIRVPLKRVGTTPGNVTLAIVHADGDNFPTGADISYAVLNGNAMSSIDYVWYDFDIPDITLDGTSKYAIVVRVLSGSDTDYILWQKDAGGSLADAVGSHSTNSGISWVTDSPVDYLFEIWGEPVMEIEGANVFSGYLEEGDWLITIAYKNFYTPYYPTEDPGAYFYLQFIDDTTVKAQVGCPAWGYRPGSIYLAKSLADTLEWGSSAYKVRLYGNFGDNPYTDYSLAALDWKGSELTFLDKWIIALAHSIEEADGTTLVVDVADLGEVLNATGHTIFSIGIPDLNVVRPNLFEMVVRQPEYDKEDWTHAQQGATDWEVRLGPQVSGALTAAGSMVGVDGKGVGGFLVFVAFLMVFALLSLFGHPVVGLCLGYPLIGAGAWYGVIDYVLLGVITFAAAVIFVYKVWLIR